MLVQQVVRRERVDRTPIDGTMPRVGTLQAGQDRHQGRLAGPVLADDGRDRARLELEVDVVERDDARKPFAEPAHLDGERALDRAIALCHEWAS